VPSAEMVINPNRIPIFCNVPSKVILSFPEIVFQNFGWNTGLLEV